jgi:hypothetical protein
MQHVNDSGAGIGDAVQDQILSHWEAAIDGAKIFTVGNSVGILSEKREVACSEINETIGGGLVPFGDVNPKASRSWRARRVHRYVI